MEQNATPVVTLDASYIDSVKIYNCGIKEDPIPGEKRGKGVQHLNSDYWISDLGIFIAKNLKVLQAFLRQAVELNKKQAGADFTFLLNQANLQMLEGIKGGLKSEEALEHFLMGSWLTMAAAEVDSFPYSKYTADDRIQRKNAFFQSYFNDCMNIQTELNSAEFGRFFQPQSRIDLIPQVALERLGIHNELCAIKWKDPSTWQREGFIVSKRVDSAKRHFDSAHSKDYEEDHIAHLIWNFMAIYHVVKVFPQMNDLIDFNQLRK